MKIEIVFVHFNSSLPKHLKLNIVRCIKLFPKYDVVLITNIKKIPKINKKLKIINYINDDKWERLTKTLKHSKDFRENFWMTSLARFLAIEQYMTKCDTRVLHVESDVVLSSDFPIEKFSTIDQGLAFPIVSDLRGIASTVFFKDINAANSMSSFLLDHVEKDPKTTDMLMLREFYNSFPSQVCVLPMGPPARRYYKENYPDGLFKKIQTSFLHFEGAFDGHDLGVYFFGTDPKNKRGVMDIRKPINFSYIEICNWRPFFSKDRNFVSLKVEHPSSSIPFFSLHAACKENALFTTKNPNHKMMLRMKQAPQPQGNHFLMDVFLIRLAISIKKRLARILHF